MSQRTVIILSWVAGIMAAQPLMFIYSMVVRWWTAAPNHPEFALVRIVVGGIVGLVASIVAMLAAVFLLLLVKNFTYHKLARFIR